MISSDTQALALMVKQFNDAWVAGATAIVGTVPEVRYPSIVKEAIPAVTVYWARWSNITVVQDQMALRNGETRRYHTRGNIFIQIFAPMMANQSLDKCQKLAMLARNAYRGKRADSMTFHLCRVQELEPDGQMHRRTAVIEYRYDQVG